MSRACPECNLAITRPRAKYCSAYCRQRNWYRKNQARLIARAVKWNATHPERRKQVTHDWNTSQRGRKWYAARKKTKAGLVTAERRHTKLRDKSAAKNHRERWCSEEEVMILTSPLSHRDLAKTLGRTQNAVAIRLARLRERQNVVNVQPSVDPAEFEQIKE